MFLGKNFSRMGPRLQAGGHIDGITQHSDLVKARSVQRCQNDVPCAYTCAEQKSFFSKSQQCVHQFLKIASCGMGITRHQKGNRSARRRYPFE